MCEHWHPTMCEDWDPTMCEDWDSDASEAYPIPPLQTEHRLILNKYFAEVITDIIITYTPYLTSPMVATLEDYYLSRDIKRGERNDTIIWQQCVEEQTRNEIIQQQQELEDIIYHYLSIKIISESDGLELLYEWDPYFGYRSDEENPYLHAEDIYFHDDDDMDLY